MTIITLKFKPSNLDTVRYYDGTKGCLTWPLPPSDVQKLYHTFNTSHLLDLVEALILMCNKTLRYSNIAYESVDYMEAVMNTGRRVVQDYELSDETNYLAKQRRLLYTTHRCLAIFEATFDAVPELKKEHTVQLAISRICRSNFIDKEVLRVLSNLNIDVVAHMH
jgi:hypothetical protein